MKDEGTLSEALFWVTKDIVSWRGHYMTAADPNERRQAIDAYNSAMDRAADLIAKIDAERAMSRSWAERLERFTCERCGCSTIYGRICGDCDDSLFAPV